MSSSHMKRLTMPRSWPLPRKTTIWVQKPDPCGHPLEFCMPLGIILRDVLGVCKTRREAKRIVQDRKVMVDGLIATSIGRGVGLMDVLTVGEHNYRCVLDLKGRLQYRAISTDAALSKPCRISGKTTISGGRIQINLHDGRNIIADDASGYSTGDTLVLSVPSQDIVAHHPRKEGCAIYLIGGSHVGDLSTLTSYNVKRSSMPNEVTLDGYDAIADHAFVLGAASDIPLEVNS